MSAFDDAIAAPGEKAAIAELRLLDNKRKGAESRVADEAANAVLLGRYRYNPGLGWLEWDGRRWDGDEVATDRLNETIRQFIDATERQLRVDAAEAHATAQALLKAMHQDTSEEEDPTPPKRLRKKKPSNSASEYGTDEEATGFDEYTKVAEKARKLSVQADVWLNVLSAGKVASVAKLCRGMDGILTRAAEFDAHPDLLNCLNCVVDLRDGTILPHDPDLLITHLAGAAYDPSARSALWDQALSAVHPDARGWFQVRMGQSITGYTPDDDAMIVSIGAGENGKTGVTIGIMRACGSYGRLVSHRVLIAQPGQHPTELMDLRGLRFALMEETPEEGRLNTHQLKMTIGTPQITARKMRHDDITFNTTHTLLINTNHQPIVDSTDHGTWRRLKALPWPLTFLPPGVTPTKDHERVGDRTLKPRLATDETVAAAALAWLVQGAVEWYANDRISPPGPDTSRRGHRPVAAGQRRRPPVRPGAPRRRPGLLHHRRRAARRVQRGAGSTGQAHLERGDHQRAVQRLAGGGGHLGQGHPEVPHEDPRPPPGVPTRSRTVTGRHPRHLPATGVAGRRQDGAGVDGRAVPDAQGEAGTRRRPRPTPARGLGRGRVTARTTPAVPPVTPAGGHCP